MEKDPQPDSITTVTIKPEYAPSEVYGSEPPPAYHRSQSSAVQVAKIIAVTVVLVSVVLGSFLLASAYVTANASCRQLEQELELFNEAADRLQGPLQPEALVQAAPVQEVQSNDVKVEAQKSVKDIDNNNVDSDDNESSSSDDSSSSSDSEERIPIRIKLPLQLDFDDLAGALMEKNQKSRMNCIVEKKRAEQIVDHQPKTLTLPFGLNLTTDPRYERISGEKMAIFCESGNTDRHAPSENDNDDDDDEVSTVMVQPVMIPIPQTHFPTHMPQQMRPMPQQQPQPHPMETMRPPMPVPIRAEEQNQLPPNQILHQIAQEIIAQKIMEAQRLREQQNADQNPEQNQQVVGQRFPIPEEVLSQLNRLPNRDMIVTVAQEYDGPQEAPEGQANQQEIRPMPDNIRIVSLDNRGGMQDMRNGIPPAPAAPEGQMVQQGLPAGTDAPVPQEVPYYMHALPQQMQVVQQQRENAQGKNGRQSYAKMLPVHIPVNMIQQGQVEARDAQSEETRPHYVQPRSVRSVDALLPKSEKRVKRCSCDCAC